MLAHEANQKPVKAAPVVTEKPATGRKRARHPAGDQEAKPGTFVGDDPSTPENEAFTAEA